MMGSENELEVPELPPVACGTGRKLSSVQPGEMILHLCPLTVDPQELTTQFRVPSRALL